jgi:hypothetical protein
VGRWLNLRLGWRFMAKLYDGIIEVAWHGQMDFALLVVPVGCEAQVTCAFPVGVDFVVLLEDVHERLHVVLLGVLHAKVINNKSEADWVPVMVPVSRCDLALAVACLVKAFGEEFLSNDAGLWETVHPVSYFTEDIAFYIYFVTESIFVYDVLWEKFNFHPEVFITIHRRHDVEVLDVDRHEFPIEGGNDAVEHEFDSE